MKNCFGYVRVSSLKQGEGVSLAAQKDAILHFAAQNEITISQWFEEQQTAAKSGRPIFNAMLKALRSRKAGGVVMHKIDRSARNFFDWAKIGELVDGGVDVYFATESLDFRSRGGRLAANVQMVVAEDYVRNLRAEVLKGQRGQLERGLYPFAAPIGYHNNGKNQLKTIDPVAGPLVKMAFELYGSGQFSLHSLRREMALRGLAKPTGEPLSKGCFEKFLANPFYTGVIRIKSTGDVYQGAHDPLISEALFQRVAEVRAGKSGKKVTRHNHLFRGLFKCGRCERSMIPERQKGHVYYRCQFPGCAGNCVRQEPLDAEIRQALNTARFSEEVIATIDQRFQEWTSAQAPVSAKQTLAMQLSKLNERMDKLEDAAIEQIIDKPTFQRRKQNLLLEKAALENKAAKHVQLHQDPLVIRKFLERLKNLTEHYEFAGPAEKREIVEVATSNRSVTSKYVSVEPAKWLTKTRDAAGVFSCAHARATSRTFGQGKSAFLGDASEDRAIQQLAELASTPEIERLHSQFVDGYRDAAFGDCQPHDLAA